MYIMRIMFARIFCTASFSSPYPAEVLRANGDRTATRYNRNGRQGEDWMLLLSYLTFLDPSAGNTRTEPSYFGDMYSDNRTSQLKSDKKSYVYLV